MAAVQEVMRGRTTLVIAHRLATIQNATRILVLRDGRIEEQGPFQELISAIYMAFRTKPLLSKASKAAPRCTARGCAAPSFEL
jgi:ABC-type transport system involved in cytochrome bd biosynthesis fused ATPase/permease subunit